MKQSKIHMESQVKMIYFMKEEKLEIILAFWGLLICLLSLDIANKVLRHLNLAVLKCDF